MTESATATIHWPTELNRNRDWMLRVLRSRVGDAHAVDDLLQDIALAVLKQSAKPSDPEKVAPWLYRLTVRQAINFHRRAGRNKRVQLAAELDSENSAMGTPVDWIMNVERLEQVREALKSLSPKDREILMLKYAENWSYEKIASHTGAKIKTIEYRLMRARKNLRRNILQRMDVEELNERVGKA
ncbi:MAG: RNA polymerase sigma factor [Pirellulaceae bacterium]